MSSVKLRLIESLRAERHRLQDEIARVDYYLRRIEGRGSGPLPYDLKLEAERRGIVKVP